MTKRFNRGFTLIELLVVIAIIGVLSSVVLSSVNSARVKGSDASIKSDLVQIRTEAEIYYSDNGDSYGTFALANCPATATGGSILNDQIIINGINHATNNGGNGSRCRVLPGDYAIAVGLKTAGQSWCVDARGISKQFAGSPTAAVAAGGYCN